MTGSVASSPFKKSWLPLPEIADEKHNIAREIDRMCQNAAVAAANQFARAEIWRAINLMLGIVSAVLATAVGVSALATFVGMRAVGIGALLAAALGAINSTLEPARKAERA